MQAVKQLSIGLGRLRRSIIWVWVLSALFVNSTLAATGAHQGRQSIRDAVVAFVNAVHADRKQINVVPDRLDQRLRLPRCDRALDVAWAPGSQSIGNTTVGVSCKGHKPWRLYVPTQVSVMARVAVAARPLVRGQLLGPEDLKTLQRDLATIRGGAVREIERVQGYRVLRTVRTGQVLRLRDLAPPQLVRRGHRVQVLVERGGLSIQMAGVALQDGAHGERIRVRNPVSNRVVEADVVQSGLVRMHHR